MRCLLPCLLVLACAAGESALSAQLPDLGRSRSRWAVTPYPALLATAWGRTVLAEWGGRLERLAPGAGVALAGLDRLAVQAGGGRPFAVAAEGDPVALRAALAAVLPQIEAGTPTILRGPFGRAELDDRRAVFVAGDGPVPTLAAPDDDGADLRLRAGQEATVATCRIALDGGGLREDLVIAPAPGTAAARAVTRWADPGELRRLPERTLWAATATADPAALAAWLAAPVELEAAEGWLAGVGLPGLAATLRGLDGPLTVWMAEGVPFPSLTLALGMRAEVARGWIAAARLRFGLAETPSGAAGFVGLVPLALGLVEEGADRPPRLVVTTDPTGLEAWTKRTPGFATHPAVAQVLDAVPERCVMLGAGRGGSSWAALAQLALPLFIAMGAPQAVSLPTDLRVAGGRGWLYVRLHADGRLEAASGGLFGGPCCVLLAAGVAVPATIWLRGELERSGVIAPSGPPPPREF